MARVIHTGDTHLGYRQYHSSERRQDFLDAFRAVVEDAIDADVDAVVHAGDLYHDRRPSLRDLLGTISVLRPLRDADIPFLAIVGNHEGTRDAQWLDLFETMGLAERLDDSGRRVGDTVFYGLDYVPESKRPDLDYQFEAPDAPNTALVSHGLFTPFAHANWDLDELLQAANVDFDAVLLGDNHEADTAEVGDTWVTYCGSTERASASERDPRGYNIVEFDVDDGVAISRKGLDTRDFVFVDVDLGPDDGTEFVRERVREHDVEDAVVIVTVEGDGETVTPADVERFGDEQGALLTRVNDRREVETDTEVEVNFADPDDAVRERVREMGLSEPALDVDETVRDLDVPDSNVRKRVQDRVEAVLDDDSGEEAEAEKSGDDGESGDSGDEAGPESEPEEPADDSTAESADAAADDPATDSGSDAGEQPEADSTTEAGDEPDSDGDPSEQATTMEDFL